MGNCDADDPDAVSLSRNPGYDPGMDSRISSTSTNECSSLDGPFPTDGDGWGYVCVLWYRVISLDSQVRSTAKSLRDIVPVYRVTFITTSVEVSTLPLPLITSTTCFLL